MIPLLNAIYSKFTATSSLTTAFPGGLFRDRVPEETTLPYLVSTVVSSKVDYAYSGPYRTTTEVRFAAYGVGHDTVGNAMGVLMSAFDDVPLTLSSGTNDSVTRLSEPMPKLHRHDTHGDDVWEWSVAYTYSIVL